MAAALLSAATGLLVAALGGEEGRARSVAILAILILSMLGGLWLPSFLLPEWVRRAALALPTTWAARGFEGVSWQGMGFLAAARCAGVMAGFSAVFLAVALWGFARAEARRTAEGGGSMNGFALILAASTVLAQAPAPVVVSMEDQFEHSQSTATLQGDVVVLLYGDRDGAEANKALGERLHVAFHPTAKGLSPAKARLAPVRPLPDLPAGAPGPDVRTVAVACVGKVGPVIRAVVRGSIRAASPDVPVWLDFGDQMKQQFPFTAGVAERRRVGRGWSAALHGVGAADGGAIRTVDGDDRGAASGGGRGGAR